MRVLVLGGAGGTGQHVVADALRAGHVVTALVRDPQRVAATSDRLRVIRGDVIAEYAALDDAMRDQDVVISTLGVGKSFKSRGLIAKAAPRIVGAMQEQSVRRLIFVSAFGVGETFQDVPFVPRVFMRTLLADIYRDKAEGEVAIRASDLDWTIVYPGGLTDGAATGAYRVGERLDLRGFPTISRRDVAAFLVQQIEATSYLKKGVLITS